MCKYKGTRSSLERAVSEHIHCLVNDQVERELKSQSELADAFALAPYSNDVLEVFEWWTVAGDFAHYARKAGEIIIDTPFGYVWGRQTTGQAVIQDLNVIDILEEILTVYDE